MTVCFLLYLLRMKAERVGPVQLGKDKAVVRPNSSLPVPERVL